MATKPLCSIDGCGKTSKARGWCPAHYKQWLVHGDPIANHKSKPWRPCSVEGCDKPTKGSYCNAHRHRARRYGDASFIPPTINGGECTVDGCNDVACAQGRCRNHHARWKAHGDPLAGNTSPWEKNEWLERHMDHVGDECLLFPFGHGRYGHVNFRGQKTHAHRAMCTMVHGDPPTPEHQAAHSCGNGHLACVNPGHLLWKTPKENQADRLVHGTDVRGEKSGTVKLTEGAVLSIRKMQGHTPARLVGQQYGVHKSTIEAIWSRRNWSWLE